MRTFLLSIVLVVFSNANALALAPSQICNEFQNLGWPNDKGLHRYGLTPSFIRGAKQYAVDYFYNLDVDNDDIGDVLELSCSASLIPADPCMLVGKLSSGGVIKFEAWHLYLVRHRGLIYAVTADEHGSEHKIYRVGEQQMQLVCTAP